ncbi:MAG: hypothetical protein ABII07_04575 [Patescibacteria group bacterium]|nr:hypothetical protein [Patescibacteria group bacterium]
MTFLFPGGDSIESRRAVADPCNMLPEDLKDELCAMALASLTGRAFEEERIRLVVKEVEVCLRNCDLPVGPNDDIGYEGIIRNLRKKIEG